MNLIRNDCLAVLASLIVMSGLPVQAATPGEWLAGMNRAFAELTYDGIFSYFTGSDLASLRVVHMIVDGQQRERLVHLNGAPREIVRTGDEVACILAPGDELLELGESIPSGPFARAFVRRFDQIGGHYTLSFSGQDRVAGRVARRIAVRPRDEHRYGYRLWLDEENSLLLRSELLNEKGERLEIFQFTTIMFGERVSERDLQSEESGSSMVTHLTLARELREPVAQREVRWHARWVPAGFTMAAADVRRTPATLKAVNTMMYSDGVAAFSIFVEDMPEKGAAAMVSRDGATVAVTHMVNGPPEDALVTLVGEVPESTARRIAESIYFRAQ
ncbi:MAG: MucB/RseB C-terminal domain-containing protein [Pseudomonadales bacterium]|jgi:sigma-E factor negative regulatory protein RseB|nr:MucB/RseB C-terminal domain-containing protein [Pseudomonadales bacterium]MDP6471675.1 MucB/RseB C-terminal domain-containing protein [Pseudomonadales bacterium]MDP6970644.1 MucB/RseB C-terminal domain-containing protein [Pseudomonadales bacterium]